jgi:hypothetical protein
LVAPLASFSAGSLGPRAHDFRCRRLKPVSVSLFRFMLSASIAFAVSRA